MGAAGGALNGVVAGPFRWFPSVRRYAPLGVPALTPGLLGSAGIGAVAAATTWAALAQADCTSALAADPTMVLPAVVFLWMGWAIARWVTTECGNVILRQAVCRAATAPAAHPSTIRTVLRTSSAEAIYETVDELVPRRVENM
jgi:hypothetical protein